MGYFFFLKSWAIVPNRGKSKKKIWLGTFFWSNLTIFISFSGSVNVFSELVIDTGDSYMFASISKVKSRIDNKLYVFSLALHCTIEKKLVREELVIFFPEMIKACPLMNTFQKKNNWWSLFGPFMALLKVAQNVNTTAGQ